MIEDHRWIGILDFSRAFDTVPHARLLGKLQQQHYGIHGLILQWIQSFLCHREMRLVVDGETSSTALVDSVVPQGTVMGSLLFFYSSMTYLNRYPQVLSHDCLLMTA